MHPPQPLEKKILVCILTKRILILTLKFIYLAPLPKKFTNWPKKSNKYITRKIYKKKNCSYPDNKRNLWTNYKFGLSKTNNNKSITNSSKKYHKNPITFTQFLPLTWELHTPLKWLHPYSHRDNSNATYWLLHTLVRPWKY